MFTGIVQGKFELGLADLSAESCGQIGVETRSESSSHVRTSGERDESLSPKEPIKAQ